MDRDPIRRQHPVAGAEIDRKPLVAGKFGRADPAEQIERTGHGDAATEKGLASQEVVTEGEIVIREAPLRVRKELDVATQRLEAGAPGGAAAGLPLEKEVLRHMVGGGEAVDGIGAEVLDREGAVVQPQLHVRALDPGNDDLAALDVRVDDPRRRRIGVVLILLRLGRFLARRCALRPNLAAVVDPIAHHAALQPQERRRQKKNANPSFHSSTCSFALRFVKTSWLLYSARRKKRRVR